MKFRAKLQLNGKTATGIQVPDKIVAGLDAGKRPAVRVTINGYTYPSTIASMGGVFMLPVSEEVRKNAGVAAGEMLDVSLELDTAPREVTVPPDFAAVLKKDAKAKAFFESLSYSNKRRHTLVIEGAKSPETRQRRIEKAIAELRAGKK